MDITIGTIFITIVGDILTMVRDHIIIARTIIDLTTAVGITEAIGMVTHTTIGVVGMLLTTITDIMIIMDITILTTIIHTVITENVITDSVRCNTQAEQDNFVEIATTNVEARPLTAILVAKEEIPEV